MYKMYILRKKRGGLAAKLEEMVKAVTGDNTIEMYHTIKKLSQLLTKPVDDGAVVLTYFYRLGRSSGYPFSAKAAA
jgi:hypothetical protein